MMRSLVSTNQSRLKETFMSMLEFCIVVSCDHSSGALECDTNFCVESLTTVLSVDCIGRALDCFRCLHQEHTTVDHASEIPRC
jgi:Asp-tRNA(Asn)/Glu-tRNA(Gln) amidotransferase B subunit